MYVATVILVMDYCFDHNGPRAKERRKKILKCFQVLKRNGNQGMNMPLRLQDLENILQDATASADSSGCSDGTSAFANSCRVIKNDPPQHRQIHHQLPQTLEKHFAAETVLTIHTSALSARGNDFTDTMSQRPLINFDMNGFDNTEVGPTLGNSLLVSCSKMSKETTI
jgi:hypothetical protein